jgi:hypothetical protein
VGDYTITQIGRVVDACRTDCHRFIKLGFVFALGILTALTAFCYLSIASFIEQETKVTHDYEIPRKN